jgi:hypothetical protein
MLESRKSRASLPPLRGAEADDGHEATRKSALFAVAEEKIPAAGGAEVADKDILGAEAGVEELSAIGFFQIKQDIFRRALMARWHHVEPLDGIGFVTGAELIKPFGRIGKLRLKLDGDFGADFVAAAADGRADGGEQVSRIGSELHLHFPDGFDDDAGKRAAPSGVNGSHRALLGINEEDGNAISGLYAEEQSRAIRSGGIAPAWLGGSGVQKMDDVGMDLLERNEFEVGRAEGGLEAAAVFEDILASVPIGEAEVQHFLAIQRGDAAGAGAEAVDQPGNFGERGYLQDFNAADFADLAFGL